MLQGVGVLNDAIYGSSTSSSSEFTTLVTHFQFAMFNTCCVPGGNTKETFIPGSGDALESIDTDGYIKFCDSLHPDNLASMDSGLRLRSCFTNQEVYRQMNFTVGQNSPRICTTLEDARVDITGRRLPGSSITVEGITSGVRVLPIVGDIESPTFGCGIGYGKAFQAAMLIWIDNQLRPLGTVLVAVGAIQLVLLLLTSSMQCPGWRKSQETSEERYERLMGEIGAKKQPGQEFNENFDPTKRISAANPLFVLESENRASQPRFSKRSPQVDLSFSVDDKI